MLRFLLIRNGLCREFCFTGTKIENVFHKTEKNKAKKKIENAQIFDLCKCFYRWKPLKMGPTFITIAQSNSVLFKQKPFFIARATTYNSW